MLFFGIDVGLLVDIGDFEVMEVLFVVIGVLTDVVVWLVFFGEIVCLVCIFFLIVIELFLMCIEV